jgi:hypothetical protein
MTRLDAAIVRLVAMLVGFVIIVATGRDISPVTTWGAAWVIAFATILLTK